MKAIVLLMCVCAASAGVFPRVQPWQSPVRASAHASVNVPEVAEEVVVAPVAKFDQPIQPVAKFVQPVAKLVQPVAKFAQPVQTYSGISASASAVQSGYKPVVKNANVQDVEAQVLRSESEVLPDGFNYAYETENGISAQATANLKKVGDLDSLVVRGSYQYVGADGVPVQVNYVADENGFQPESNLLPVAPPVPEAILRSLEYIRTHVQPEEVVRRV